MKARVKSTGKIVDIFVCEEKQQFGVIYTPQYFASELDFNVEDDRTIIIDGYIHRDKDNMLYLCDKSDVSDDMFNNIYNIPSNLFPDLKYESGPKEISITIKLK